MSPMDLFGGTSACSSLDRNSDRSARQKRELVALCLPKTEKQHSKSITTKSVSQLWMCLRPRWHQQFDVLLYKKKKKNWGGRGKTLLQTLSARRGLWISVVVKNRGRCHSCTLHKRHLVIMQAGLKLHSYRKMLIRRYMHAHFLPWTCFNSHTF